MRSRARLIGVVLLVQSGLLGAFWLVELSRGRQPLSTEAPQRLSGVVPELSLRARDGTSSAPVFARTTLLHIWATWCPPCREELPALLAVAEGHEVGVIAVALDERWDTVDRFLEQRSTRQFLGDREEIQRALGVHTLPATFVIGPDARLRYRFDGARDWSDQAFVRQWLRADEDR